MLCSAELKILGHNVLACLQEASVRPCFAAVIGRVRKLLEEELARKQQKGSTQQKFHEA